MVAMLASAFKVSKVLAEIIINLIIYPLGQHTGLAYYLNILYEDQTGTATRYTDKSWTTVRQASYLKD